MTHTITLTYGNENYCVETSHSVDESTRRFFDDLINAPNIMHWTDGHIIQFLTTKGNMVSECIMPVELDKDINIATMSALGKFRNSKILIFCIYSHSHEEEDLSSATYQKILKDVLAAIPIDPDKTPVWAGWIRDKKIAWRNAAIKLVAICPEEEDKNEPSQQN